MIEVPGSGSDIALERVCARILELDPEGERFASLYRHTFDQLYDGQRTGRYKWDQLYKTEKTHYGTLIEINMQREFAFPDGDVLDFQIAGEEVDCKYSFRDGGWMLPPECWGQLVMVSTATDESATWSLGVVRATEERLNIGRNRDSKATLNTAGREATRWLFRHASFPPNVLLQLSSAATESIFGKSSGQARLDELFRQAEGLRIHRNTIATVAQQQDYMKRLRSNGGSRSRLRGEGYLILGGDYANQRELAVSLGLPEPRHGEVVSVRVGRATPGDPLAVEIGSDSWRRLAPSEEASEEAPLVAD